MLCALMMFSLFVSVASGNQTDQALSDPSCALQNFQGSCDIVLPQSSVHVSLSYVLNYCSKPQDVTFKAVNMNTSENWQHSFANSDEMQPVPVLSTNAPVQLRVQLLCPSHQVIQVKAMFYEAGESDGSLVNHYIQQNELKNCSSNASLTDLLPLIVFVALLVLVGISGSILLYIRLRHRQTKPNPEQLLSEDSFGLDHTSDGNPYTSTTVYNNRAYVSTVTEQVAQKSRKHRRKRKHPKEDGNTLVIHGRTVYKKVDIVNES